MAAETPFEMACRVAGVTSDGDRKLFEFIWKSAKETVTEVWGVPDMTGRFAFDFLVARVAAFQMDARGASGDEALMPVAYIDEAFALKKTYAAEVAHEAEERRP